MIFLLSKVLFLNFLFLFFNSFKSFHEIFDALGEWVYADGAIEKEKVKLEGFKNMLEVKHDHVFNT